MSDDASQFRQQALSEHNRLRELHGAPALRIASDLERSAQKWAEALVHKSKLENSAEAKRGECGESISQRSGAGQLVDITGAEVTAQWYKDIENYDFSDASGKAGNFTQLVWIGSREVGFGKAQADGKVVTVAHYRPPGNVRGRYDSNVKSVQTAAGRKASQEDLIGYRVKQRHVDVEEVHEAGKTFVIERERVQYEDGSGNIKEKITERKREKTDQQPAGKNQQQQSDRAAADDHSDSSSDDGTQPHSEKELAKYGKQVLAQHNKYRAKHSAKPLKINKELSALAQSFAEELATKSKLYNSNANLHGNRLGENIASRWSNGVTDYSAEDVVDHWYQEAEKFRYNEEPDDIKGVGNFTQLVWKNSKELGVGKAVHKGDDGSHKVVVVCYYNPSGNVMKNFNANVSQPSK